MTDRPIWYGLDERNRPIPMEFDDPRLTEIFKASPGDIEHDRRRVAISRAEEWEISTVFLGVDHNWGPGPPILWETMVFGPEPWTDWQDRYSSHEEAAAGHARVLAVIIAGGSPDDLLVKHLEERIVRA